MKGRGKRRQDEEGKGGKKEVRRSYQERVRLSLRSPQSLYLSLPPLPYVSSATLVSRFLLGDGKFHELSSNGRISEVVDDFNVLKLLHFQPLFSQLDRALPQRYFTEHVHLTGTMQNGMEQQTCVRYT